MGKTSNYLLAIESAVSGGSIALLNEMRLIAARAGGGSVSRAGDLLPNIISLLEDVGLSRSDLTRIVVSLGPGSYTGLRIGIATALGLGRGLAIPCSGVPLFNALLDPDGSDSWAVVPIGKADLCFALSTATGAPIVGSVGEFQRYCAESDARVIRCHHEVFPQIAAAFDDDFDVVDLGSNLADHIGRTAVEPHLKIDLEPIYVANPRFGSAT